MCETDDLPKSICKECWKKTEDFHIFHRFVQSAQSEYLNSVIKTEHTSIEVEEIQQQPNFVEVVSIFPDSTEFHEENPSKCLAPDALDETASTERSNLNDSHLNEVDDGDIANSEKHSDSENSSDNDEEDFDNDDQDGDLDYKVECSGALLFSFINLLYKVIHH